MNGRWTVGATASSVSHTQDVLGTSLSLMMQITDQTLLDLEKLCFFLQPPMATCSVSMPDVIVVVCEQQTGFFRCLSVISFRI